MGCESCEPSSVGGESCASAFTFLASLNVLGIPKEHIKGCEPVALCNRAERCEPSSVGSESCASAFTLLAFLNVLEILKDRVKDCEL